MKISEEDAALVGLLGGMFMGTGGAVMIAGPGAGLLFLGTCLALVSYARLMR